jgi:hypothetical protein
MNDEMSPRRSLRRSTLLAVVCQIAAAAYLQIVEWIDLFPWNDVAKGNAQEKLDIVLLVSQALIALWYFRQRLSLMLLGWLSYAFWFYLQIVSWWQPYLFAGRTVGPNWYFARTYKFLPQIDARPTPDADHVVLQILLLAVLVSGAIAIWHAFQAQRAARRAA